MAGYPVKLCRKRSRRISCYELQDASQKFVEHDLDGNDELDRAEFVKLLKNLGMATIDQHEAGQLFVEIDTDHSGNINLEEFTYWYSKFLAAEKEYISTDADSDGKLDVEEFKALALKLGIGDESEAEKYFKEVDTDRSGTLDLKEFVLWYSTSSLVEAKKRFEEHDDDGNGELDMEEFVNMLPRLRMWIERDEAEKLFTEIDADFNGSIDKKEFASWYLKYKRAEASFIDTDADGNGDLDMEEFKVLACKLLIKDDSEAKKLFEHIDADRSGLISLKEFVFWYSTSPLVEAEKKLETPYDDEIVVDSPRDPIRVPRKSSKGSCRSTDFLKNSKSTKEFASWPTYDMDEVKTTEEKRTNLKSSPLRRPHGDGPQVLEINELEAINPRASSLWSRCV